MPSTLASKRYTIANALRREAVEELVETFVLDVLRHALPRSSRHEPECSYDRAVEKCRRRRSRVLILAASGSDSRAGDPCP